MKANDVYPSNFLKATDLQGHEPTVVIASVSMEDIGTDRKPVLHFQGKEKGMVLNRTNWDRIAYMYGDESDDWPGKAITLYAELVSFQGRTVEAIRIRPPRNRGNGHPQQASQPPRPPHQAAVEQRHNYELSTTRAANSVRDIDDGETIPF